MNRRTMKMTKALKDKHNYSEDNMDDFSWYADVDKPEEYIMTFLDHMGIQKRFIHNNETKEMKLYVWRNQKWIEESR